jgi:membrane-bound lytic murein transglycosylase D
MKFRIKKPYYPLILFVGLLMGICLQSMAESNDTIAVQKDSLYAPVYDYEYIPDATYDEVEKRFSMLKTEIPVTFNERVKAFIDYFTVKDREYTKMVVGRSTYYFPIFEYYLTKYDMPDEIKYLAIVESGLSATARSRAAAVGLWQFMYTTGRMYGLHADWFIDERMDPHKSTEAACLFLQSLYGMFGDWELALAAYNCGPGNVRKAIRRSGYKKNFWEIFRYLPRETRGYVPQFLAFIYVFNHLEEHNFFFEEGDFLYPLAYDTIMVKDYLDLQTLGDQLNVCVEDLERLNPSVKRKVLPELKKAYTLNIPSDVYEFFQANRKTMLDSSARTGKKQVEYLARNSAGSTYGREKIVHRVRSGEVLGKIANQYHVRVSDIRRWNNLHGNLIRVGQRLNIWLQPSFAAAQKTKPVEKEPVNTIINGTRYHIVQPGDTLWSISKIYEGLSIEKIKEMNNLSNSKIKPGQKLMIG